MDSIIVGCPLHICRKLARKTGDQSYDPTLSIIVGSFRKLVNLIFCIVQQVLQFTHEFR